MITAGMPMPSDPGAIEGAASGLVNLNLALMRRARQQGRQAPPLYKSGVRYRREPAGQETWDSWDRVLRRGYGDCEDLAAWRAAELRFNGIDRGARVAIVRTGPKLMHAVVRRSNGAIEDPSRRLGMGADSAEARTMAELGAAPGAILYRIVRTPGEYQVRVYAPGTGAPPIFGTAKDANMGVTMPFKAPPAVKKAVKKKRRKKSSRAARIFGRLAKNALKTAGPAALNIIAPGAGTAAAPLLQAL